MSQGCHVEIFKAFSLQPFSFFFYYAKGSIDKSILYFTAHLYHSSLFFSDFIMLAYAKKERSFEITKFDSTSTSKGYQI